MNEDLKKMLVEYLGKLLGAVEKAGSFAADQIPIIIQEKLQYDFWLAVGWMVIAVLMLLVGGCCGWCIYRVVNCKDRASWWYDNDGMGISSMFGVIIFGILGIIIFFVNAATVLQITIAPRLYIVEWLKGMV